LGSPIGRNIAAGPPPSPPLKLRLGTDSGGLGKNSGGLPYQGQFQRVRSRQPEAEIQRCPRGSVRGPFPPDPSAGSRGRIGDAPLLGMRRPVALPSVPQRGTGHSRGHSPSHRPDTPPNAQPDTAGIGVGTCRPRPSPRPADAERIQRLPHRTLRQYPDRTLGRYRLDRHRTLPTGHSPDRSSGHSVLGVPNRSVRRGGQHRRRGCQFHAGTPG
jgi:hypothetical protein